MGRTQTHTHGNANRHLKSPDETIKLTVSKQAHHYRDRLGVKPLEDNDREKWVTPWLEVINRYYLHLFPSLHHPSCSIFTPLHQPNSSRLLLLLFRHPCEEDGPPSFHPLLSNLRTDQEDLLCTRPQFSAGHTRPLGRSRSNSICKILCIDPSVLAPSTPSVQPWQALIDPHARFLGSSSSSHKCSSLSQY